MTVPYSFASAVGPLPLSQLDTNFTYCGPLENTSGWTASGVSLRFKADMSNATIANQFAFQTNQTNSTSQFNLMPSGSALSGLFTAYNSSDMTNAAYISVSSGGSFHSITAGKNGTGSYLPISFYLNNSEKARFDISGNFGLGVVPSTWSTGKAAEIGSLGNSLFSGGAGIFRITSNAYFNSSYIYASTNAASMYQQNVGAHSWHTAASNTIGSVITFTQVLAVDKDKSLALQGATSQPGGGISFPATFFSSNDANTLDDYEEGTFSPTVFFNVGGSTGITYSARTGTYTKIGNKVFYQINIALTSKGTGTGAMGITSLPFTSDSLSGSTNAVNPVCSNVLSTTNIITGYFPNGSTSLFITKQASGSSGNFTDADATNTTSILITGHYQVAT